MSNGRYSHSLHPLPYFWPAISHHLLLLSLWCPGVDKLVNAASCFHG